MNQEAADAPFEFHANYALQALVFFNYDYIRIQLNHYIVQLCNFSSVIIIHKSCCTFLSVHNIIETVQLFNRRQPFFFKTYVPTYLLHLRRKLTCKKNKVKIIINRCDLSLISYIYWGFLLFLRETSVHFCLVVHSYIFDYYIQSTNLWEKSSQR